MDPAIRSRRESVLRSLYSTENGLIIHFSAF